MRCVVVGAGAIGANIAYALRRAGAEVVLVEGQRPAAGTTRASFAWLCSFPQLSWGEDPGRSRLRENINKTFLQLQNEIGGDWLDWCGTLTDASSVPKLEAAMATCREKGVKLELLDAAAVKELSPGLDFGPDAQFVHEPQSGWIDAPLMVHRLVDAFTAAGGRLCSGVAVTGIEHAGGRIRSVDLSDGERIEADVVVNAAGSWSVHVAALAGLAFVVDLVPGVMLYLQGSGNLPRHVIKGPPHWLMRPDPDHGVAIHARAAQHMTDFQGGHAGDPEALLADIAHYVPALRDCHIADVRIGIRAVPQGGPVIGSLPWLDGFYMAVSHGGIGWGPTWGEIAVRELLQRESVPEMAGLRPERFYTRHQPIGDFADDAEQARRPKD